MLRILFLLKSSHCNKALSAVLHCWVLAPVQQTDTLQSTPTVIGNHTGCGL